MICLMRRHLHLNNKPLQDRFGGKTHDRPYTGALLFFDSYGHNSLPIIFRERSIRRRERDRINLWPRYNWRQTCTWNRDGCQWLESTSVRAPSHDGAGWAFSHRWIERGRSEERRVG